MMSTIYTEILSLVKANFTDKTELVNPYIVSDNDDLILKDAFGIQIGGTSAIDSNLNVRKTFERTVVIKLVRKIFGTERDISQRQVYEKGILDDTELLINFIEGSKLSANSIKFSGDSGIDFVFGDRQSYIFNEVSFTIVYTININKSC